MDPDPDRDLDPDPDRDLDPDPEPNWAKILDPDPNSMYLDPQDCYAPPHLFFN